MLGSQDRRVSALASGSVSTRYESRVPLTPFFQLFARRGLAALIGVATALTMLTIEHADARAKKRVNPHRVVHGRNYHPPYAAIVIDVNSGQVLHQANCDEPRRPASLTKIMTLYLLFEQLQSGELR